MAQAVAESGDRDSLSQQDLSQRLTVIVTTSPVRSHPDTTVICTALNSFHLVPGLEQTRKLIVCDGYVVSDRSQFKKGRITPDVETGYAEYKSRLRSLIKEGKGAFCNTELVELGERGGFGYACKVGADMTSTPYVLIVQHDRIFRNRVDLSPVLNAMDLDGGIRYVSMPTTVTRHAVPPTVEKGGAKLKRLYFWYDSTHVCRSPFYRDLFTLRHSHFAPPMEVIDALVGGTKRPWARQSRMATAIVKKGCSFVEDTLGQLMLAHLRYCKDDQERDRVHALYGTWCLAEEEVIVSHLDGREYLTPEELQLRGWYKGSNVRMKKRHMNTDKPHILPPKTSRNDILMGEQDQGLLWIAEWDLDFQEQDEEEEDGDSCTVGQYQREEQEEGAVVTT